MLPTKAKGSIGNSLQLFIIIESSVHQLLLRVYEKQPLYSSGVGIRFAYTLSSPDSLVEFHSAVIIVVVMKAKGVHIYIFAMHKLME